MAVAQASRVRIQQQGNTTLGVREDIIVDERTGLIAKRETVVAEVPLDGGGTAVFVGQKTVHHVQPPVYSRIGTGNLPAIEYTEPRKKPTYSSHPFCSVAGTLQCEPLHNAGITSLVVGGCAIAMGCLCCACVFSGSNDSKQIHTLCCCFTCVVFLAFTAAVVANSVYVFLKIDFSLNVTYMNPEDVVVTCVAAALPFGLTILSYALLILFLLFCCYSTAVCFFKVDGD